MSHNAPRPCLCVLFAGWEALQVLLLRDSLDKTQISTLFRASKTAAETVLSSSAKPFRLLLARHRHNSTCFADLLTHLPKPVAGSKQQGSQVYLTLCWGHEHCLPRDHITRLCFKGASFTREEWFACANSLRQYQRLRTLQLQGCSCSGAGMSNTQHGAHSVGKFAITIDRLEIENNPAETLSMVAAMPAITGQSGYAQSACKRVLAKALAILTLLSCTPSTARKWVQHVSD